MILPHHGVWPRVHETVFVAPSADLIGDVTIGERSSVWFQVVIRGDVHSISIGERTNIQDHSMLHVTRPNQRNGKSSPGAKLTIGDDVTVGHRVTLHGCTIGNRILIGMGAVIMDGVEVADDCIIGAGALLTQGLVVPKGSLVLGAPAKVARPLKPEELAFLPRSAANYVRDSEEYRSYVRGPKALGRSDRDLDVGEYGDDS